MVENLGGLKAGTNSICELDGKYKEMMMDISVLKLEKGMSRSLCCDDKEMAVLLITGKAEISFCGFTKGIARNSEFDENPWCLHVPKGTKVDITASESSEFVVQCTTNDKQFDAKLYSPDDCKSEVFGDGEWNGTARRVVRTVFDYGNAPYSNMVMGEVITYPGKWSSYPPHYHPQPEVYYYKFDRPEGFGLCLNGNKAYMISDNSFAIINSGDVHPQTSAPGYAMYYCWMIRHLAGNPWRDRIVAKEHEWLCGRNIKIWPEKQVGGF